MINKKEALTYDDVLLVPQYSDIRSRSEVSVESKLGSVVRRLPIIASPMDTISELEMATAMSQAGALAVIHRYNSIREQSDIVEGVVFAGCIAAAAIGTAGDYLDRAAALHDAGATILCCLLYTSPSPRD